MDGDFNIGTILYLVITLVVVLIGVLGRKKKSAGSDSQSGRNSHENDFMENLERTFNVKREAEEVRDEAGEETGRRNTGYEVGREREPRVVGRTGDMWEEYERLHGTEREKKRIAESGYESGFEGETEREKEIETEQEPDTETFVSDVEEPADHLEVIELGEYEGTNYFDIVKDFDAGTAVVYSAIINRTEY